MGESEFQFPAEFFRRIRPMQDEDFELARRASVLKPLKPQQINVVRSLGWTYKNCLTQIRSLRAQCESLLGMARSAPPYLYRVHLFEVVEDTGFCSAPPLILCELHPVCLSVCLQRPALYLLCELHPALHRVHLFEVVEDIRALKELDARVRVDQIGDLELCHKVGDQTKWVVPSRGPGNLPRKGFKGIQMEAKGFKGVQRDHTRGCDQTDENPQLR